jgi:hypothetical protein
LIEPKYIKRGIYKTSFFATNLEHLMNEPIKVWICGHTHSVIDTYVNNIFCGVNAYGYPEEHNDKMFNDKYIEIIE